MNGDQSPHTPYGEEDSAVDVGLQMARTIFKKRGDHSEIHLAEGELAGLLGAAYAAGKEASKSETSSSDVPKLVGRILKPGEKAESPEFIKGMVYAASLYEQVNSASDFERQRGDPGAGAMGAVLEFRDLIRKEAGHG